jgi:PhnB protein
MKSIPEGFHTLTPVFEFKDARKAIEFYKKAFGAVETHVTAGPEGKGIMHASLKIGDSNIMLSDEKFAMRDRAVGGAEASPVTFYLYVENADAAFKKAVAAGASVQAEPKDAFWGDRMGAVKDPFGFIWTLAAHVKDVPPEEIKKAAEESMLAHSSAKK